MAERFWPRVDQSGECWVWRGGTTAAGYGVFYLDKRHRLVGAHRMAWEMANGPIPFGLHVLHRCDNPPCVNPSHLFLGTRADNMADMSRKGRANPWDRRGERNPSAKLTWDAVRAIRARYGAGGVSQASLGQEYGVSQAVISEIVLGQKWAS